MVSQSARGAPSSAGTPDSFEPLSELTDPELIDRFASRDGNEREEAFTALVRRHGPMVLRVCRRILPQAMDAEDAFQAVFLVLARKAGSLRKHERLKPWLHGVTVRTAMAARRQATRRRAREEKAMNRPSITSAPDQEREELLALLNEEIQRLPGRYRDPVVLCELDGLSRRDAAQRLGLAEGTLSSRLARGRAMLRERLARRGAVFGTALILAARPEAARAGLSGRLVRTTVRHALRFAAGGSGVGTVPAAIDALAKTVLVMLSLSKLRTLVLALLALCGAAGMTARLALAGDPQPEDRVQFARSTPPGPTAPRAQNVKPTPRAARATAAASPRPKAEGPPRPDRRRVERLGIKVPEFVSPQEGNDPVVARPPALRDQGRELFAHEWQPADPRSHGGDGLGPVFNARSCLDCHAQGGPGGAGPADRNIQIATASGGARVYRYSYNFGMNFGRMGQMNYWFEGQMPVPEGYGPPPSRADLVTVHPGFVDSPSVVLHRFGTDLGYVAWRQALPGRHGAVEVRVSERNPTPLFGAGLIDAIPDGAIEAAARVRRGGSLVQGRMSRPERGRIGRFGWKAQTATLEGFVRAAAATELGLEVPGRHQANDPRAPGLPAPGPDLDQAECDSLVAYVRGLPAPLARGPEDETDKARIRAGSATFKSIGCAQCHLPKLGEVVGIYSDLLLHDMGPDLADTASYSVFIGSQAGAGDRPAVLPPGTATAQEWRTPPLWGLSESAPYLHDGRAATLDQAIRQHGGEAEPSAVRYANLSRVKKRQLDAFLMSLGVPAPADP